MKRRNISDNDKKEIGLQCCNCGSTEDLQYHHIVPIAVGGEDINSNMCCLCYKCHYRLHHHKENKVSNFSELIKEGQSKARLEGRAPGQKPNEVTVVFNDGKARIFHNPKEVAEYLSCNLRSVQNWCKGMNTKYISKNYNIKKIYYSKINCYNTKLDKSMKRKDDKLNKFIDIMKKIKNSENVESVSNQLAFF